MFPTAVRGWLYPRCELSSLCASHICLNPTHPPGPHHRVRVSHMKKAWMKGGLAGWQADKQAKRPCRIKLASLTLELQLSISYLTPLNHFLDPFHPFFVFIYRPSDAGIFFSPPPPLIILRPKACPTSLWERRHGLTR